MMRTVPLALSIALLAGGARAASLDRTQINDLFSQAKDLFRRANALADSDPAGARDLYQKAALRFERIARDGRVHNGRLYYNIANTYFRMGDIGRAILYYRYAERTIPNDPNLQQNLSYARSRRVDQVEEAERTRVLKTLFFWHYDLPSRTRLAVFALGFAAVWLCAIGRLFSRRALLAWGIGVSVAVSVLMGGSLLADEIGRARHVPGVVLAEEAVARRGDSETYQPMFEEPLHAGTEFELVEDRGEWLHVELADGRRCWLPATAAGVVR